MTYVIAQSCVDVLDKACIEECPVDCIYEGERMLYIHPDECVDCGACEPVCPVEAIYYEDDVPEQWKAYTKINADFFDELGSPGGASKVGKVGKDDPARRGTAAAGRGRVTLAARLPEYPWDELAPIAEKARAFPGGSVDLSIGTPVDPVPAVIQQALAAGANAPGYPLTAGTPQLRAAAAGWLARTLDVHVDPVTVLPVIGTKEFIAWLPTMLGLGPADTVLYPSLAYPTYEMGCKLSGAAGLAVDDVAGRARLDGVPEQSRLLWLNSPSNPTGQVLAPAAMRDAVSWARSRGAVLASDECYITLGWETTPTSVLHDSVRGRLAGRAAGRLLAVQAVQPGRVPGRASSPAIPA